MARVGSDGPLQLRMRARRAGPGLAATARQDNVLVPQGGVMKAIGLVLIVIGVIGLLWGGITWTREEQVVDLGPIEVNTESRESIPVPPLAGAVCLLAGTGLLLAGRRG